MKQLLTDHVVLIADDEHFSRMFVVRMLRELGCAELIEANNGAQALLRMKERVPSVVVLDFNMPGLTGLDVLKGIRIGKAEVPRGTKAIMLTGNSDVALVKAAMALDVDSFIVKPVSLNVLSGRLEKVISETREIRPVADYCTIPTEAIGRRLLGGMPAAPAAPAAASDAPLPAGAMVIRLDAIPAGAIVARDVCAPSGDVMIGSATVLSDRLLRRLKELQPATKLEQICVFLPAA